MNANKSKEHDAKPKKMSPGMLCVVMIVLFMAAIIVGSEWQHLKVMLQVQ